MIPPAQLDKAVLMTTSCRKQVAPVSILLTGLVNQDCPEIMAARPVALGAGNRRPTQPKELTSFCKSAA
jgi:hypothetical protein